MSNQRNNGFSADEMIEVCNLEKSFGDRPVLKDISFSARPGELIALLGPNGAGKTTLMRILCGYLPLDAGTVQFDGIYFAAGRQQILKQVGYMPENVPLYSEMTVYEYLRFVAGIYRMKKEDFRCALEETAAGLEIVPVLDQKIHTLSKGYKRRTGLAAAVLHRPRALILDEPTEGLDPNQKIAVRQFLRDYAAKNLIIISTHLLEEAEALATRVLVLAGGQIRCDGSVEDLRRCSDDGTLPSAFYRLTRETADEGKGG